MGLTREVLALLCCTCIAIPASAQTAAQQPRQTAEQTIQMFVEAGFPVKDGKAVNRCGTAANPRVAFIDLNGDRKAEAHIADVDLRCYGKPGAFFAILAQQPGGAWKRLIAEDGIVSFQRKRTAGWNDLSLDARYSACPGARQFTGTDYGAPTACAASARNAAAIAAAPPSAAPATPAPTAALSGSRSNRLAQIFVNIMNAAADRSWASAAVAFPGARWSAREQHAPYYDGSTHSRQGKIDLGGSVYTISLNGLQDRIKSFELTSPDDDLADWTEIASALNGMSTQARNIGCLSPTGFGYVRLTKGGKSAVLHKFVNYGSRVPSTDVYAFMLDDPFQGSTELQVASDRSLC